MAKSYPQHYSRYNGDYLQYAELAMKHYLLAKEEYITFKDNKFLVPAGYSCTNFEDNCMITIVFSTMAIESFLNDYAAACMGDANFYDSFDKLDILAKFQLIAKCILEKDFNKGCSYYSLLKALIKKRNLLIHNKSHNLNDISLDKILEQVTIQLIDDKEQIKGHVKPLFSETRNAIKAIVEVAMYFEENDENSYACLRLLGKGFVEDETERYIIRKEIYKEFKVK